jgi:patatin-related protein
VSATDESLPFKPDPKIQAAISRLKNPEGRVQLAIQREVRFAVVMYGGVSLAIYINGVAQELLTMVRATAPQSGDPTSPDATRSLLSVDDAEMLGTAGVYRKLGQYLDDKNKLALAATLESDGKAYPQTLDPIRTRFVVDIVSGTSAGGINGVFLSKALARNQKMDGLKQLWLQEGDLSKLLNDTKAADYSPSEFAVHPPETSLLNSRRMYRKLLEALARMGEEQEDDKVDHDHPSPLVAELDLFITTTDIDGIPLPISLADDVVYERRYKNVFHFRYAPDPRAKKDRPKNEDYTRDDFQKDNDPFLAFAARCTSSFPFAFEAMCLKDIESILENYRRYQQDDPKDDPDWDIYFKDYLRFGLFDIDRKARGRQATGELLDDDGKLDWKTKVANGRLALRRAFRTRAFGDGGYLDNKPFSHATSMLMRRNVGAVVERKLIYVEPTPEHPEFSAPRTDKPNFAENVMAAALDLPRQETIREDLERLEERNEMLERIGTFARNADTDYALAEPKTPLDHDVFAQADLKDMMKLYGVSYGAYHRLNIEVVTSLLAGLVSRALGYDPASDAEEAVTELVNEWRRRNYHELKAKDTDRTENQFLIEFDIRFRLRRLIFLVRRVNELANPGEFDAEARGLIYGWLKHRNELAKASKESKSTRGSSTEKSESIQKWFEPKAKPDSVPADWIGAFQKELARIKRDLLARGVVEARLAEEKFTIAGSDAEEKLNTEIRKLKLPWKELELILDEDDEVKDAAIAKIFTTARENALEDVANVFREAWKQESFTKLNIASEEERNSGDLNDGAVAARLCLDHYYRNFVVFDLVTFPVQYGSGAGEANIVKVYRVSPEDARSLINERRSGEGRRKLAGRAVMSFGAFLDQRWRKNDMLWGRLDGAERLISILLPDDKDEKVRKDLIKQAHMAILSEEISAQDLEQISRILTAALANCEPASDQDRTLRTFVETLLRSKDLSPTMYSALRQCLQKPTDLWTYFKCKYEVDRRLDPESAVRLISRGTAITGKMLDGLSDDYQSKPGKSVAAWLSRIGAIFWSTVTVAVPRSIGNLLFQYWLGLLYLFAFLTIFVGLFINDRVKIAGWEVLGIIMAVHLLVIGLANFMAGGKRVWRAIKKAIVVVLAGLIILGGWKTTELFLHLDEWHRTTTLATVGVLLLVGVLCLMLGPLVARWARSRAQIVKKNTRT